MDEPIDKNDVLFPLINFLDIETLIRLYNSSFYAQKILESNETLFRLYNQYDLPRSSNFKLFVENYDNKYLTKRCSSGVI